MKLIWLLAACGLAVVTTTLFGPTGVLAAAWVWVLWLVVDNRITRSKKEPENGNQS